jgi:alginate O-acetyltransferase complex protein AlgI
MLFNTFQFLTLLALVLVVFFALPDRWHNPFLLIASYYFYMCWSVKYITVIWGLTLVDYFAGILIEQSSTQTRRQLFLAVSVLCNFGMLFVFKYFEFFASGLRAVMRSFNLAFTVPALHLLLPVGISFHTFQAVSYTVEIYRGKVRAERSLLKYALYVAFFPQLVAGPIERPNHLLPQFGTRKTLDVGRLRSGLEMILWGLFKKSVVADLVAEFVTTVYSKPGNFSGPILLLATLFFTFQIYCDFSGYSDMAVGIARIMGYDLVINFRQPYTSRSVAEFWQRWHISLSTWFRDYLYIPVVAIGSLDSDTFLTCYWYSSSADFGTVPIGLSFFGVV